MKILLFKPNTHILWVRNIKTIFSKLFQTNSNNITLQHIHSNLGKYWTTHFSFANEDSWWYSWILLLHKFQRGLSWIFLEGQIMYFETFPTLSNPWHFCCYLRQELFSLLFAKIEVTSNQILLSNQTSLFEL